MSDQPLYEAMFPCGRRIVGKTMRENGYTFAWLWAGKDRHGEPVQGWGFAMSYVGAWRCLDRSCAVHVRRPHPRFGREAAQSWEPGEITVQEVAPCYPVARSKGQPPRRKLPYPDLRPDQLAAIDEFAANYPKNWRAMIRSLWVQGRATGVFAELQRTHGPTWLRVWRRSPQKPKVLKVNQQRKGEK